MQAPNKKQLQNLIEFAFAERRYHSVIQVSEIYLKDIGSDLYIRVNRIKAFLEIGKSHEAIKQCQEAMEYGATWDDIGMYRIRSYLQSENYQQAQNAFNQLIAAKPQYRTIINYQNALQILRDKNNKYKLSNEQQSIIAQMKKWLYKAGANYDKMKVVNFSQTYRGVITTKSIKKGQQIVYVPKSQIMTLQYAKMNRFSKQLINNRVKLLSPKHTYISILLLQQRANPKSKYKPYIDLLPKDHSNFPINFNNQQLQMLLGSPFLFMISEKVKDLSRDYNNIIKCCQQFEKYTFKDFCWARMMVGSRIFGLNITGIKTQVLVPFADMLNHKLPKQTAWNYIQNLNGFVIQSLEDIDLGQQVFDSYGRKCNSRFLLNYGFIIEDNADNQIALKITIDESDQLWKVKLKMMQEDPNCRFSTVFKVSLNLNNNKFYQFMGCLRFCMIRDLDSLKVLYKISNIEQTKQPYKWSRTPPLSLKNQIMCWYKFVELCKQSLANYPQSIEEDRKFLKQSNLTQNMKNIIHLRMGQKYLLTQYIELGTQVIAILENQAMLDILEKQKDKIYYKYLCKMLSVLPGINKLQLNKRIGQNSLSSQVQEEDCVEEQIN